MSCWKGNQTTGHACDTQQLGALGIQLNPLQFWLQFFITWWQRSALFWILIETILGSMDCQDFQNKELIGVHFALHRETGLEESKVLPYCFLSQDHLPFPNLPWCSLSFSLSLKQPLNYSCLRKKHRLGRGQERTSTPEYLSLQFGGWDVIKYINHVNNKHLRNVSYSLRLPIARLLNFLKIFSISFL